MAAVDQGWELWERKFLLKKMLFEVALVTKNSSWAIELHEKSHMIWFKSVLYDRFCREILSWFQRKTAVLV